MGPALSDGKRFDAITSPRLIFTLEMGLRERAFAEIFDSGFSKFHGPSGSEVRFKTGSSSTRDLMTTCRCRSAPTLSSASIRAT